jgi:hypothetical protein
LDAVKLQNLAKGGRIEAGKYFLQIVRGETIEVVVVSKIFFI